MDDVDLERAGVELILAEPVRVVALELLHRAHKQPRVFRYSQFVIQLLLPVRQGVDVEGTLAVGVRP